LHLLFWLLLGYHLEVIHAQCIEELGVLHVVNDEFRIFFKKALILKEVFHLHNVHPHFHHLHQKFLFAGLEEFVCVTIST